MRPVSVLTFALMLIAAPVRAQTPPAASAIALQINAAVANLALELDQLRAQNAALQKQIAELQKAREEPKPVVPNK